MRQPVARGGPDILRVVPYLLRLRPWVAVLVVTSLCALILSAGQTVPSIQGDPAVPRTRVPLLYATLLGSAVVLLVRPVLHEPERMAARSMRAARCVIACMLTAVGLVAFLLGSLALPFTAVVHCIAVGAALVGLGMMLSSLGTFWGLSVPWLYVFSGLAFGYQASVAGQARLRPWAWLVDPGAPVRWELGLFAIGLAAFVLVDPRADRE